MNQTDPKVKCCEKCKSKFWNNPPACIRPICDCHSQDSKCEHKWVSCGRPTVLYCAKCGTEKDPVEKHEKGYLCYDMDCKCHKKLSEKNPVEKLDLSGKCRELNHPEFDMCSKCGLKALGYLNAENVQSWGERFDKEFGDGTFISNWVHTDEERRKWVKQFISTEIQRAYEEGLEEGLARGLKDFCNKEEGRKEVLSNLKLEIGKMEQKEASPRHEERKIGYNLAINDSLTLLDKMAGEEEI